MERSPSTCPDDSLLGCHYAIAGKITNNDYPVNLNQIVIKSAATLTWLAPGHRAITPQQSI
ncbi:MAG TPA: hypothetical protein VH598_10410 [Verrucomicrobiae bacterium]|nr:hypothetical protein [Verrucomicrobiae bacterium]